ncbi:FliH/SctL family protein [uncultured Endozoicomonas sp.]|uniref:FliH/SctL family protein n=1 Tax=uncultured Endozoicomonas sp. TaxID=432652 RepID=UPI002602571A|nr:FliH/SctL family protein [uncultured Endozoicomonas sp.]
MKSKTRIWQPETAAYQQFHFPAHEKKGRPGQTQKNGRAKKHSPVTPSETPIIPEHSVASEASQGTIEKVQEQHEAELQSMEQRSYQRGYDEGRRQGFEEASKKIASQTQQVSEQQKALVDSLHREISAVKNNTLQNREQLSVWLGQVVEEVCRQVVRKEMETKPELIVDIIRQSLELVPESNSYTIQVCDQDAELLRRTKPDFGAPWQLVVTENLMPGDCRIVASEGEAEARLDNRLIQCLDIIKASLVEDLEAVS